MFWCCEQKITSKFCSRRYLKFYWILKHALQAQNSVACNKILYMKWLNRWTVPSGLVHKPCTRVLVQNIFPLHPVLFLGFHYAQLPASIFYWYHFSLTERECINQFSMLEKAASSAGGLMWIGSKMSVKLKQSANGFSWKHHGVKICIVFVFGIPCLRVKLLNLF